jgi:hypothetical protein
MVQKRRLLLNGVPKRSTFRVIIRTRQAVVF